MLVWLPGRGQGIEFSLGLVPLVAVPLLEAADDLIPPPGGLIQVVVGQLSPLLLEFALELLPVPFDPVPIHGCLLWKLPLEPNTDWRCKPGAMTEKSFSDLAHGPFTRLGREFMLKRRGKPSG